MEQRTFYPGEKRRLDLTVVDKPDRMTVSIRDNGSPFDPLAYLRSEEGKGYGILLIHELADHTEYRRNTGLNNFIIHLKNRITTDALPVI